MEKQKVHFRHVMLYCFQRGLTASQTLNEMCSTYRDACVTHQTIRKWYRRFEDGDFNVEDQARSGRPQETDETLLKDLVHENPRITIRELADTLQKSISTVHDHLKKLGYSSRLDVWVPHELGEQQLITRVNICDMLLRRHQKEPFLKRIITGDETWILYNNISRKRSWGTRDATPQTVAKPGLHPKKVLLSIWWDFKGVVYYELLQPNETINAEKYSLQLDKLKAAIAQKRPALVSRRKVIFQHDNARPHVAMSIRRKLLAFDWDVLPHPPYSPDIAPSDYYLFLSLKNFLRDKKIKSLEAVKMHLDQFFASKNPLFWSKGIMQLPKRWAKVIEQNGTYLLQ